MVAENWPNLAGIDNFVIFLPSLVWKSTLRLSDLQVGACSGLTLSGGSLPHLQRRGLVAPEMVEIELGITCKGAEVVKYKFLRLFLSDPPPIKINIL